MADVGPVPARSFRRRGVRLLRLPLGEQGFQPARATVDSRERSRCGGGVDLCKLGRGIPRICGIQQAGKLITHASARAHARTHSHARTHARTHAPPHTSTPEPQIEYECWDQVLCEFKLLSTNNCCATDNCCALDNCCAIDNCCATDNSCAVQPITVVQSITVVLRHRSPAMIRVIGRMLKIQSLT